MPILYGMLTGLVIAVIIFPYQIYKDMKRFRACEQITKSFREESEKHIMELKKDGYYT